MPIYSKFYLKDLAESLTSNQKTRMFSETKEIENFDIFLSHSFLDKEEVLGIFIELTRQGFKVYVDWIVDSHLERNNVTLETAKKIRSRLRHSKTLILAMSENCAISKWIPWELGYVDGHTDKQCALLPVSQINYPSSSFKRAEYFALYPYLTREYNSYRELRTYITDSSLVYVDITQWINGKKPEYQFRSIF